MSNPEVPFPDPIDFAALGRLDAAATPEPWSRSRSIFVVGSGNDDGRLIVAMRNAHAAYREVVVAAKALADAVNGGKFTRVEDLDLLPKLDAALARFRNIGGAS